MKMPGAKRSLSDSEAQRRAETLALRRIAIILGVPQLKANHRIPIGSGWVSVDGFMENEAEVVMVEVNAHVGRMKAGTRNKVMKDALKLLAVSKFISDVSRGKKTRCALVFVDKEALESFGPKSWGKSAFGVMGIETWLCQVTPSQREALALAQSRQDLRFSD